MSRRVSRAAMRRREAELRTAAAETHEPDPDLVALVAGYTSNELTEQQLLVVRPFLLAALGASNVRGKESRRKFCTHLAGLAGYALDRGHHLDTATALTTALIDEYVTVGMRGCSAALRAERRRRLLALASAANPGPHTPARLTPIPHATVRPCYRPDELAVIKRVSLAQPTQSRQRNACAVVGVCAGAGADSVDLRDLRVRDVRDLGAEGIDVHFGGPRPRVVPVRAGFESLVRAAIAGRHPDELLIGEKPDRRNTAAQALEGVAGYKIPRIEPSRLRASWLADLMTDAIPIGVILQAAGLKSARTLAELLPHLDDWLRHKQLTDARADVRGGAR